jgi:DNA end-binding protein Ku
VPREERVQGYEISKDKDVRLEPEELKVLEPASSSALVIATFVTEQAVDPVYLEGAYYLDAGKNGERGYRVLVQALEQTHRVAVGTFTWRGNTTPIAIRAHQDGLLLQRFYFADDVHNAAEIDRGTEPKGRDQERTLAERLISELSGTQFQPESYEDEYRKRLMKAIEQKVAGQEIERIEVETRPPTTDLVATLKASLEQKGLATAPPTKTEERAATPSKRPVRRRRAS